MIKLIALDVDGTLLDSGKNITQGTRAAIRQAREAGIKVVLATGRIASEAAIFAQEAGADAEMIVAGGAAIADARTGKNVYSESMPPDVCADVLTCVQQAGMRAMLYVEELLYSRPCFVQDWVRDGGRAEGAEARHVTVDNPAAEVREKGLRVNKIFVGGEPAALRALAQTLRRFSGVHVTSSGADNIEIMPQGANKGAMLRRLANDLGIDIGQTMAIGDSDNDRDMLAAAGTAVLMANGDAALRPLADHVTADNDHDGVAHAIYEIALKPYRSGYTE